MVFNYLKTSIHTAYLFTKPKDKKKNDEIKDSPKN